MKTSLVYVHDKLVLIIATFLIERKTVFTLEPLPADEWKLTICEENKEWITGLINKLNKLNNKA